MKPVISAPLVTLLAAGVWGVIPGAGVSAWAGSGGFEFSVPPGWVDISPGAPEGNRQKAPPQMLAVVDGGRHTFFAVDIEHGTDGFITNMNALVQTGERPPLATPSMLDELEKGVEAEVAKQGMSYRALKKEIVKIAGVTAGRMVGEIQMPGGVVSKLVQYSIPGHLSHAALAFATTPERFAHYQPIFDQAAQATRGAVEPRNPIWDGVSSSAIAGGTMGGLICLIWFAFKRWKKGQVGVTQ